MADPDALLAQLTFDEKIALVSGADSWQTVKIPRLGIGAIRVTDGPNGARGTSHMGPRSVCTPCGAALGATWNRALVREVGALLGREAARKGADVLLAPTINLHRHPLGGRVFECFSEDPLLTAELAVAYVTGVQSEGVGACAKHFVANDHEAERHTASSEVSERTLREVYLRPFEATVAAGVEWVMSAYNKLNGTWCGEHPWLLSDVLRDEWGFEGVVVSDWFGTHDAGGSLAAGLDLEMPGPPLVRGAALADAIAAGDASEADLDRAVLRLLRAAAAHGRLDGADDRPEGAADEPDERRLLRRAAASAQVLLVNDGALPLTAGERVALVGPGAVRLAIQGGGSANVSPHRSAGLAEALAARGVGVTVAEGCRIHRTVPAIDATIGGPFTIAYRDANGEPDGVTERDDLRCIWMGGRSGFWSATATGTVRFPVGGDWRLALTSVGPARLFLDGELVVDNSDPEPGRSFFGNGSTERVATTRLEADRDYELVLEYEAKMSGALGGVIAGAVGPEPADLVDQAVAAAREADVAVVVVGTDADWETEGRDRSDLQLPGKQDELIAAVAAVNPRTVVVVNAGSPVAMPWADDVEAILQVWFGGQEMAEALADVLVGALEPTGRMPTTIPFRIEDGPSFFTLPPEGGKVPYGEGLLIGDRWYATRSIAPRFGFGHGLGYVTAWQWGASTLRGSVAAGDLAVEVELTNADPGREGGQVVQVYASRVDRSRVRRPARWLAGFENVTVPSGMSSTVIVPIGRRSLEVWHPAEGRWVLEPGTYELAVGPSAGDVRSRVTVTVD